MTDTIDINSRKQDKYRRLAKLSLMGAALLWRDDDELAAEYAQAVHDLADAVLEGDLK